MGTTGGRLQGGSVGIVHPWLAPLREAFTRHGCAENATAALACMKVIAPFFGV